MKTKQLAASNFKAHCLRLLDDVALSGDEIVITKRGSPVARILPFNKQKITVLRGSWSAYVKIQGNLASFSTADDWGKAITI